MMSLKDSLIHYAQAGMQNAHSVSVATGEVVQSQKFAHGSAIATIFTGIATALEKIDVSIGSIASLFGILLTITLIIINIRKDRREDALHQRKMRHLDHIMSGDESGDPK